MAFVRFLHDRFNLILLGFLSFFILVPFLETQNIHFPVTPFILVFALILCLYALSLSSRSFWQLFLLAILAFCFDLLLVFILNPFLDTALTFLVHGIYGFCFMVCLGAIIEQFFSPCLHPHQLLKMGFCGYCGIGFLWMVFYSFIFAIDPKAFGGLPLENVHFFSFSFSTLALLIPANQLASVNIWIRYLAILEAIAGQIFLVILIVRAILLYHSYEAKR